jgi:hypothetical protein
MAVLTPECLRLSPVASDKATANAHAQGAWLSVSQKRLHATIDIHERRRAT